MALRLTPRSPRGPALLPPFGDNACALRRHQHRDARTTRLDRAHRIVRRRGTNPRCNPMRPPHPAPDVRDDREAPLKRGGTEGMIHDFWKKERRILRNRSAGMMGLKRQEKAGFRTRGLEFDGYSDGRCGQGPNSLAADRFTLRVGPVAPLRLVVIASEAKQGFGKVDPKAMLLNLQGRKSAATLAATTLIESSSCSEVAPSKMQKISMRSASALIGASDGSW
jgi:hypothetical protein